MFKLKNPIESIFIVVAFVLLITFAVLVSLVGKNLTYTTRFTPPSTERSLKNESYFTESQAVIVVLGGVLILLLPSLSYTVFMKSRRYFVPLWGTYIAVAAVLLLSSLYYLVGSQGYRDFLSQVSAVIDNTPGYCEKSLCNKATCARMSSYHVSRQIVEAFMVICSLGSLYVAGVGFLINKRRRKSNEIELIM